MKRTLFFTVAVLLATSALTATNKQPQRKEIQDLKDRISRYYEQKKFIEAKDSEKELRKIKNKDLKDHISKYEKECEHIKAEELKRELDDLLMEELMEDEFWKISASS